MSQTSAMTAAALSSAVRSIVKCSLVLAVLLLLGRDVALPLLSWLELARESLKRSALEQYLSKYMPPTIEAIRLLTLLPMAWGAWIHNVWLILLGLLILALAWCNGLIVRRRG